MVTGKTLSLFVLLVIASQVIAGYTTPNTGVNWNLDSLVSRSGGTLTGSFPNYTLNDTLTISALDRLTILPGSIITVSQGTGKGFTVFGMLRAVGTLADSIIVKGSVDSAGWHRGFRFEDSSVDTACVIAYARIMNAVEGVHCLNANPAITNTRFTKNSSNGIRCFGASPVIRDCVFEYNRQSAITANVNSSPLVENNLFAHNNYQNTGARNAIAIGGQGVNNPVIRGNEIYNRDYFRAGAISLLTLTASDVCNAIVENNYLHNNSFGIVVQGLTPGGTLRPLIRNNRIENNRINPDPLVSGSGITVQVGGPTNAPVITGNILRNNYWGVTIVSSSGLANSPQPILGNIDNADTTDDGWNIFDNNNNGGTIYQLYNNGTANILAQNNYWGSVDSTTIEQWIVHQPDSAVFGFVQYRPFGIRGFGAPEFFAVRQVSENSVRASWRFRNAASGGIRLYRGADSTRMQLAATLSPAETAYTMQAPYGVRQFYGLSSFNRFGESDTTLRSFMITDITPPAQPVGFFVQGIIWWPSSRVELSWRRNTENDLAAYNIYRSVRDTNNRILFHSVIAPDTAFTDTTIGCDTTYYYWLTAVDTAGNESPAVRRSGGVPCPLSVRQEAGIPQEFFLEQNYPNPFNPLTSIRFSIPDEAPVRLLLFDVLGRISKRLVDERLVAGSYTIQLDGGSLPSGVYFYRLEAAGRSATRRLALIR